MTPPFVPVLQTSTIVARTAATWCFDRATTLVVMRGRVWITIDGAANAPDAPSGGDWFLPAGAMLRLAPRQPMVIEAAGAPGEAAAVSLHADAVPLPRWLAWVMRVGRQLRVSTPDGGRCAGA
ncbi:DUF2917 domain-containing protein [Xylophilus sp. GOD-11R]|uniref:DUF2917 domain-containing protein n=1 Tax=Xylophilus sp. GOD-11R TaxID=3089814 RepID=UPI00298D1751|nr:DUF2917 domain-containing protein [Xylophilus sp. GOD-11R]WPB56332.1 DUF2917 domain-containing protein [Xylophilus sp. GOD-11R]